MKFFRIVLCLLSVSFCFMFSQHALAAQSQKQAAPVPLAEIQRFTTAIGQIKSYYVEPVDDEALFEDAIRGMLSGLDPHSSYLDVADFNDLKATTSGEFGGLGIEVGMENGYVKVISPIDDTPADKAGLKPGDLIIKLDETPVKGLTLREAVSKMRGKKGSDIILTIYRQNEKKPFKVTITREIIKIQSVKSKLLEDGYGYVRISHFQAPTAQAVIDAVKKLQKQSDNGKLNGLVLDVRSNPGGLLDAAVDVSDAFLNNDRKMGNKALIVYTEGRIPGSKFKAYAKRGDVMKGAPMVVLINNGSASASEIVAGALQDHNRAVLMGTNSFGKGSVQTILPLDDKRGVKLTTALYFTPSGRSIQAEGITPDIIVKEMKLTSADNSALEMLSTVREADLDGHIESDGTTEKQANSGKTANTVNLAESDYQLYEALNLLKGLNVLQPGN